ncbi:MAG: hypothetical protein IBX53_03200 [Halomonas sp.]|uniref:hypothetical protein n=1 Tax=Halomonas sp. TaxID=1486246 RepID=UPI0019F8D595|nr:hypothetical protein [Halomonas sp.]MBE0488063.1 hypothetical protein [Halomonas sp.]
MRRSLPPFPACPNRQRGRRRRGPLPATSLLSDLQLLLVTCLYPMLEEVRERLQRRSPQPEEASP